jgi:hypothetical protein
MAIEQHYGKNWVASDGSYGLGSIITYNTSDISGSQWDIYEDLDENDKFLYIQAIINGDSTTEWED